MDDPTDAPKKAASHRTAAFILIAMAVTIAFYGWQTLRTRQLSITSVSKSGEYRLPCSRTPPSHRWIHVTGWIDGQAILEVPGGPGPERVGPGAIEWKVSGPWDAGDCVLKYSPGSTTLGKLSVEYRIE
ncbi:MAG TPA: hypothetical protein VKW04_13475 [Planctomycetota bacterium]|nr:hypothetical protein [Planctomycetota bacterium]